MDKSNANSDGIYEWVNNEPSYRYIKKNFLSGFEESHVFLKNEDNLFKCYCCFLIPRFPLVFKCGHPSCYRCFPESFKCNEWCNYCIIPLQITDILTLNDDRLLRLKSFTAQMYEEAEIQCTNTGCKLKFNINEINKHEFLDCPYRIIKCPAKDCYYKTNPNQIHMHPL